MRLASGTEADVLAVYPDVGEALVAFATNETARFRFSFLTVIGRPSE